jgi:hypothetical protein
VEEGQFDTCHSSFVDSDHVGLLVANDFHVESVLDAVGVLSQVALDTFSVLVIVRRDTPDLLSQVDQAD